MLSYFNAKAFFDILSYQIIFCEIVSVLFYF